MLSSAGTNKGVAYIIPSGVASRPEVLSRATVNKSKLILFYQKSNFF